MLVHCSSILILAEARVTCINVLDATIYFYFKKGIQYLLELALAPNVCQQFLRGTVANIFLETK